MAMRPVEDIDAVLGRFQAWTGTREAGVKARVREMSDEEALASGRYRWKPERAGGVKSTAAPIASSASTGGRAKAATEKKSERKRSTMKRKNHAATREETAGKAAVRKKEEARSVFREVLAEAVLPAKATKSAEVIVKAKPAELSRQVAISIRLAASERALIKTRAAEAGITASAYIRQCALEVEQLREQVRQAVAAMERGAAPSASAAAVIGASPVKGFFGWMARKLLPRKLPALALRA